MAQKKAQRKQQRKQQHKKDSMPQSRKQIPLKRVLMFHDGIFLKVNGSLERLLRDMMSHLLDNGFAVQAVSSKKAVEDVPVHFSSHPNFSLATFDAQPRRQTMPFDFPGMAPELNEILDAYDPDCILATVWAEYQFPIVNIPRKYPLFLISPFGHYCSNGNVRSVMVSGAQNTKFLNKRGIPQAKPLFNPIKAPTTYIKTPRKSGVVTFCRTGRGDDDIFDPISLRAFAKIEQKYGDRVLFRYVNASPRALALAKELGLKRVKFESWLTPAQLSDLYHDSDVFLHARYDGETGGIAIAEAMLHGCSVVTHVSHHHNDHLVLIAEPSGRVAPSDDVDAYAAHIEWFITHHDDVAAHSKHAREKSKSLYDEQQFWNLMMADFNMACSYKNKPLESALRTSLWHAVQAVRARAVSLLPVSVKHKIIAVVSKK